MNKLEGFVKRERESKCLHGAVKDVFEVKGISYSEMFCPIKGLYDPIIHSLMC